MSQPRGSALLAAVLALALGGAIAATLAEIARRTVARERLREHAARAWFLAEAGLAETLAATTLGRSFDDDLATPTRAGRDGRWTWISRIVDDADGAPNDTNERVLVRVEASGPPPVRRRLEAVVGREREPFLPGAATLGGSVRELTRDFRLNGRDFDMASSCAAAGAGRARAGLALPEGAAVPPFDPAQVVGGPEAASVRRTIAPDLTPLAEDPMATRLPGGTLASPLGHPIDPRFSVVHGDAIAATAITGAGMLYVEGRLSVRGALDFTGVVAAADGIDVAAGASLTVCGAVWAGGEPALAVRGRGAVRRSTEAILLASRLAPLPARAHALATRELFGGTDG